VGTSLFALSTEFTRPFGDFQLLRLNTANGAITTELSAISPANESCDDISVTINNATSLYAQCQSQDGVVPTQVGAFNAPTLVAKDKLSFTTKPRRHQPELSGLECIFDGLRGRHFESCSADARGSSSATKEFCSDMRVRLKAWRRHIEVNRDPEHGTVSSVCAHAVDAAARRSRCSRKGGL